MRATVVLAAGRGQTLLAAALSLAVVLTMVAAVPADADHNSAPPAADDRPAPSSPSTPSHEGSLDIELKLGLKGFRFGSRIFDRDGYAGGAWLNGETGPRGFSLDGRLERDGRAHNFKMNVDIDEALRGAGRWFGFTDL